MQLQAWSTSDDAPPTKVITNGCMGLFWLSLLVRVLIHLCRRYYGINKDQRRALRIERYTAWQNSERGANNRLVEGGPGSGAGAQRGMLPPEM